MNFGLSNNVIDKINSVFKKYPSIEKVILYGSRAKGNYKPASDIDLTIISSTQDLSFLFRIENEIDDLLLPYKVDLSFYSLLDNENLRDHINRVGVIFYVQKP
ncbi:MAG TPA: nucleotidyltransferase domain-containing protein [Pseudobdellovibrionaceae bacterium]